MAEAITTAHVITSLKTLLDRSRRVRSALALFVIGLPAIASTTAALAAGGRPAEDCA